MAVPSIGAKHIFVALLKTFTGEVYPSVPPRFNSEQLKAIIDKD
jgi:hypothetical protein